MFEHIYSKVQSMRISSMLTNSFPGNCNCVGLGLAKMPSSAKCRPRAWAAIMTIWRHSGIVKVTSNCSPRSVVVSTCPISFPRLHGDTPLSKIPFSKTKQR